MKSYLLSLRITAAILASLAVPRLQADDTNDPTAVPFHYLTNNLSIASNAPRSLTFLLPSLPVEEPLPDSPATSTNFFANGYTSVIPPDSMGAAGTNRIMVMINGAVQIQDRDGTVVTNYASSAAWWSAVGPFNKLFDPRVTYDPYRDRWIATTAVDPELSTSSLLVGVSATGDPAGAWYRYRYNVGGSRWADFPLLGFNKDKVVVSFTYWGASSNGTVLVVFDKETLYSGTAPVIGSTYSWRELGSTLGMNLMPALTYDTNQASLFLVQSANSGEGRLALYEITGTAAAPVITTNAHPTNPTGWAGTGRADAYGNFALQAGTSQLIDTGDDRMASVVYRNGVLWCAQTIFLPANNSTYSAIQ